MQRQAIIKKIDEMLATARTKLIAAQSKNNADKIKLHRDKELGLMGVKTAIESSPLLIYAPELKEAIQAAAKSYPRLTEGTFSTIKKYFNEIAPGWDKQKKASPALMFASVSLQEETDDLFFKIVLIGDSEVGKSRILSCLEEKEYVEQRTIGLEFSHKRFDKTKLQIWDTADRDTHAFILMFDLTKKETFNHIEEWYQGTEIPPGKPLIILVGNKSDLKNERAVTKDEAEKFASRKNIKYVEISDKNKAAVDKLFNDIVIDLRAMHVSAPMLRMDPH